MNSRAWDLLIIVIVGVFVLIAIAQLADAGAFN